MARHAELVILGRVATLEGYSGFGWQSGIAVAGGRVLAAGSESDVSALIGTGTTVWRLGGELAVMPAITDAHLHLMTLVLAEQQLDLTGLDLPAALDALGARHAEMERAGDRDGWLLGHGWTIHDLGGWPDADQLDRVAPGRPVALYAHDHHSRWISRAAMKRAGIDAAKSPVGGLIRRDDSGRPTGLLHEGASSLVDWAIPSQTEEDLAAGVERVAASLAALGVTGCHDPGELTADNQIVRGPLIYRLFAEQGRLPLRVHGSVRGPQLEAAIAAGLRSGQRSGRFTLGWLKLFSDGSLGSRSAAMLEPYSDAADNPPTGGPTGMVLADRGELDEMLGQAARAGIVGQVHAIGDAAVRTALDALAEVAAVTPEQGDAALLRRVEHAQLIDPADQPRFGALGIAASVQPVHLRSDAESARAGWAERSEHAFPLRGLLDGGALIPFGTDAPVEPTDPWPGICVAVTRREPFRDTVAPLGSSHAIGLARAIRAACLDPAIVAGDPDLGRLTRGSRADLLIVPAAVLDETLPDPAALASTCPLATLIDGRLVHRHADFAFE